MQLHNFLLSLFLGICVFSELPLAWPWPPNINIRDIKALAGSGVEGMLGKTENYLPKRELNNLIYGRADNQDDSSSDADSKTEEKAKATDTAKESDTAKATDSAKASDTGKAKATSGAAATTETASATGTAAKTAKGTGTETASATGTSTGKDKDKSKTTKAKSKTFDARLPSGGISMITPGPYDGDQFYKIGEWVTFAWNYTSLSVTPSAVNVLASCSVNSATYTIAANMSVDGPGTVYWNTNDTQASATQGLVQETYTLIVYDAGSSISATAGAGYLGVSNTFRFGMYQPQPYTPRSQWNCPSCNAAFSTFERQTMGFLLGTFAITVASFTWFVVGFGVI